MSKQLSVADLGELGTCHNCGKPTFKHKPEHEGKRLPKGFTLANRHRVVRVSGVLLHVCEKCRYDVYGRY